MTQEEKRLWKDEISLDKKQVYKAGEHFRSKVVGNHTYFNINAFQRDYKLSQAYMSVRNLDFHLLEDEVIQSFKDYHVLRKEILKLKFLGEEKPRPKYPVDESYRDTKTSVHYPNGDMLVLIDSAVYNAISASIDQYVLDVGRDGYWATIHIINGGTPSEIRSYIHNRNPVGALLVGAIAAPWFELDNDFHGVHSEFPCDLYYMDKDGTWGDPDNDGKFSSLTGNVNPDIWVGRIYTPTAGGNDATLINDYFKRNHLFRLGKLGHAYSALAYVDDDWTGFDDCAFDHQFPSAYITKYTNPGVTDADLYKSEVNSLRAWVQLCAHSGVQSHQFTVGSAYEYISTPYFRDTNPPNAHFYNLFCCGPGRFTSNDYLAGWYIFDISGGGTNLGLAAIASSKSGSMLYFEDFYQPLGDGKIIGDAFVDWWQARGPSHDLGERQWFYGLILLGDPTLTWWKGAVPQLEQPQKEDVFDHWPRKIQLRWDPVSLPNVTYTIEVDAFHAVTSGKWAEETNQSWVVYHNVTTNTIDHTFVGMQRGRWRVHAKVDNKNCSWTPWRYFKFTI